MKMSQTVFSQKFRIFQMTQFTIFFHKNDVLQYQNLGVLEQYMHF